jgi:hypothetical protein
MRQDGPPHRRVRAGTYGFFLLLFAMLLFLSVHSFGPGHLP